MEPTSNSFSGAWAVVIILVVAGIGGGVYYVSTKPDVSQEQASVQVAEEQHNENIVATTTQIEGDQSGNIAQVVKPALVASTSPTQSQIPTKTPEVKAVTVAAPVTHSDWATLTSYQGFSMQYPYKQIGAMWGDDPQLNFFMSGEILKKGTTTAEIISTEINNFHLYSGLGITVIKATTTVSNFDTWLQDYRKNHPARAGVNFKITSEQKTKTTLGGLSGYLFTQVSERKDSNTVPRYVRKDIFVRDASNVYYFSYITSPTEGIPSSAPELTKLFGEYFSTVGAISEQVLKTVKFDNSKIVSTTIPKTTAPKLTGEAAVDREKLLAALRVVPYFDTSATYPPWNSSTRCADGLTTTGTESTSTNRMTPSPGIYFKVDNVMSVDNNDLIAEIHGYDEQGWHTGPGLPFPGFGYGSPTEEFARSIDSVDYGSYHALAVRDNINGKIVIKGKKYALGVLQINGEGNNCTIAEVFIPLTPYSIATIPMTKAGDVGPISYDIDGDGVEDFQISLLYPMTPQKTSELNALLIDMQPGVPSMERAQTLYTPFFANMPGSK